MLVDSTVLSGGLSSFGSWIFYSYFPYPLGFCPVSATFVLSGSCNPLFKCTLLVSSRTFLLATAAAKLAYLPAHVS